MPRDFCQAVLGNLASLGAAGVQRVIEILQAELVMAMARTGRPSLASIDRTLLKVNFR